MCGDEVMLLERNPEAEAEFCRLTSGLDNSMLGRELAWTLWSRGAATPETDVLAAFVRLSLMERAERVERFDEER